MNGHHYGPHMHADKGIAYIHAQRGPALQLFHHNGILKPAVVFGDAGAAGVGHGA